MIIVKLLSYFRPLFWTIINCKFHGRREPGSGELGAVVREKHDDRVLVLSSPFQFSHYLSPDENTLRILPFRRVQRRFLWECDFYYAPFPLGGFYNSCQYQKMSSSRINFHQIIRVSKDTFIFENSSALTPEKINILGISLMKV